MLFIDLRHVQCTYFNFGVLKGFDNCQNILRLCVDLAIYHAQANDNISFNSVMCSCSLPLDEAPQ